MARNVIAFRCSSVIYPHLRFSPSHFQNSSSTFSIERVNRIPPWDFYASDLQRACIENNNLAELLEMFHDPGERQMSDPIFVHHKRWDSVSFEELQKESPNFQIADLT